MSEKIKHFLASEGGERIALALIVLLVGVISFGLGRMSIQDKKTQGEARFGEVELDTLSASAFSAAQQADIGTNTQTQTNDSQSGQVVASKNGEVYHYPWCSGAQRMKEENKIYFNSITEAKAAGLRPAANCPELE